MKMACAVYSHPEYYPPTLNALNELATIADSITVLGRNVYESDWHYPDNVELKVSDSYKFITETESASYFWKLKSFLKFTKKFYQIIKRDKPDWIIVYDAISLLSFQLVKKLFFFYKPYFWYHNHDVSETPPRRYSISWFAERAEKKAFNNIDVFSLPTIERKKYFDLTNFKGKFFSIPNFPSLKLYNQYYVEKSIKTHVVLLYQGRIAENHGLEKICSLLQYEIGKFDLRLHLKGMCSEEFYEKIQAIAHENNAADKVKFLGLTSYRDVPIEGNKAHIGIAIFTKEDKMNNSLGTASNKIYEYAAMGLPILYYDNPYFNQHLGNYNWAIKCDITNESLTNSVSYIINNYQSLSIQAREDFMASLNFEYCFKPVIKYISEK